MPKLADVSIKEAAGLTRDALGLPLDRPVGNLTDAAERAGVLVFMLPTPIEKGDAFSVWAGASFQTPVIAVGAGKPGDRVRLSIAHELGELVLHHAPRGRPDEMERIANKFAAELLMPEDTIRQEIVPPVTLTHLAQLKLRWRVSIQALCRRAYDLEIVTRRQYNYLFEQLSSMGWRRQEPENLSVPVEKARGLRKMIEVLYGNPPHYERLATDARLTVHLVRKFVEAQAEWPAASTQSSTPTNVIAIFSKRKSH